MARVLHLLPRSGVALASAVIRRDLEAGDEVAVALLGDAGGDALPAAVDLHRVPTEWSYDQLLEQIFAADRVVTW
jgi:NAD(P)H-hydrate repair Nnr-like enzyme with NAD(P)H-hydrate epimerase domain